MIFCGICLFSALLNIQKSNYWLSFILPTLVMAKIKKVWHCLSDLTSWFYLTPSLEPILNSSGKKGWFQSHFSADGLPWNNFAERLCKVGKKNSLTQFNSMIYAELSYSPLKLIEKTAVGELNFCCNPIRAHNFAVPNEAEPSTTL